MEDLSEFLRETDCIDFSNPLIVQKADELKAASSDEVDYIERAYKFVRDEIPHSWDARLTVVSKTEPASAGQNPACSQPCFVQIKYLAE